MDFEAAKVLCRSFAGCTEDIKWGAVRGDRQCDARRGHELQGRRKKLQREIAAGVA